MGIMALMFPLHPLLLGFLVALGVGLLIGIDRERKKSEGPAHGDNGGRCFPSIPSSSASWWHWASGC